MRAHLLAVVAACCAVPGARCAGRARRRLTSDYVRPASSDFLPARQIVPNRKCAAPPCSSQVHVALAGPFEAVVSFASATEATPSVVSYGRSADALRAAPAGERLSYTQLMSFDWYTLHPAVGLPAATEQQLLDIENTSWWAQGTQVYNNPTHVEWGLRSAYNPAAFYASPVLHHVRLSGLAPGERVHYRVPNDERRHAFRMPPASGASVLERVRIGLVADLGQTPASNASIHALLGAAPDAVLLAGDLAYADGYLPRWDSFAELVEPLASRVPVLTTVGNHEVHASEGCVSYNARWRNPSAASGSSDNTYWGAEIGPVHVLALNSYAPTQPGSRQHAWLQGALARVDRARTPWLVVMMHAPFYCSNVGHVGETRLMRAHTEALLRRAGVDLVLNGHVHAYERTHPTYAGRADECGPVYLTLGDGGNREGMYIPWAEPQPEWSAYRESSFGVGMLDVLNRTHARYEWRRHSCQGSRDPTNLNFNRSCESINRDGVVDNGGLLGSDAVYLTKPARCANKLASGAAPAPAPELGALAEPLAEQGEQGGGRQAGALSGDGRARGGVRESDGARAGDGVGRSVGGLASSASALAAAFALSALCNIALALTLVRDRRRWLRSLLARDAPHQRKAPYATMLDQPQPPPSEAAPGPPGGPSVEMQPEAATGDARDHDGSAASG